MYKLLLALATAFSHIPLRAMYCLADILFYPVYYVARYRRSVVHRNLRLVFPDMPAPEMRRLERRFYRFLLDTIVETHKALTMSEEQMRRHAVFKNVEAVRRALEDHRSVAVYIGHYGNWEWMASFGLWTAGTGAQMTQIYRRLNSRNTGRLMMHLRQRFSNVCVEMRDTVRYLAAAQREGRLLVTGFIADQSPKYRDAKHFLRFLGQQVPVQTGTEKVVRHFNHHAMFLSARRLRRGYYEYEFSTLCDEPRGLPEGELTRLYFERLEQEVRRCPELYLWSHNRFKYAKQDEHPRD